MLLTAPLLSKSTFFGSLLNKCRQVIKPQKTPTTTTTNNTIKNTNNNNFTPTTNTDESNSTCTNPTQTNALANSRTAIIKPPAIASTSNVNRISTTSVTLKTIEERVGLPPRPKRPLTPYFRYVREVRSKMMEENPKIQLTELISQLAKKWPTVDASIKQRLQEEYHRDRDIYVVQRTKYDAKITDEQRAEILNIKQEKQDMKARRIMRQRIRSLGRPKRPSSAFLRFIQKERESTPQLPQQTYREWHQKSTAKWTRMSDAEKERFKAEAQEEFETYRINLGIWEEKMMKLGNLDVVRSGQLIDPPEPKAKPKVKRGSKILEPIQEEILPQQSKQKKR